MKKKIKDLTITECIKICNKQKRCGDCPLDDVVCKETPSWYGRLKQELEKEVEVDESINNTY